MSKMLLEYCCALVLMSGVFVGESSVAQTSMNNNARETAAQQIAEVLAQPLQIRMSYEAEQLDIVLAEIEDEYNIPIVFEKSALDEVAISSEAEVSIDVDGISLRAALNLVFMEPGLEDLCYVIDDEVLLITTKDRANDRLVTKVYRADDFELTNELRSRAFRGASAWADFSPMIDVITACVEPKSWRESGQGGGEIRLMMPDMLVITQTRHVHEQIQKLFDDLRDTRRKVLDTTKTVDSSTNPETHGFPIHLELGANPEQVKQQLVEVIKKSVEWSTEVAAGQEVWIEVLPNRVLVRHVPKVLSQVEGVLLNAQILDFSPARVRRSSGGGRGGAF